MAKRGGSKARGGKPPNMGKAKATPKPGSKPKTGVEIAAMRGGVGERKGGRTRSY